MTDMPIRRPWTIVTIVTIVLVLAAMIALPSAAQDPPADIQVDLLTPRSGFTDDVRMQTRLKYPGGGATQVINTKDASRTVVARITVQPGKWFPWHTHPGPVVVNVAQGDFVVVNAKDCVERPYPAGTAFIDPGHGNVHSAYNPSDSDVTVLYATFFEAPAAGPLTVSAGISQTHCGGLSVGGHGSH